MFSYSSVEKLRSVCATKPVVLSLYLPVPLDPAGLRGLAAEAGELMAGAASPAGGSQRDSARVSRADREAVLGALAARGRDWLGHTVAFFASQELGLFEALPLRYPLPARAVLAGRPYIRPLLAAVQRGPDYQVAIADREHAWVLSVSGGRVETIARQVDRGPRSAGFGGWYGLQAYRIQRRITQLGRHHYLQTAAILKRAAGSGRRVPLVIGGHHDSVAGLLRALPAEVRDDFAGSFHADPHTLTEAGVRELADPVIGRWVARRERELCEEILSAGRLAAVGLPACFVAVGRAAVDHLLVPEDGMIPGFACGDCGQLSAGPARCPDCGTAAPAVPDLLEEMVQRTLDDNGQVSVIRDAPFSVAAKLRFPVTADGSRR
jgi:Bacterial archaeo-eukaryotic release factor family 10